MRNNFLKVNVEEIRKIAGFSKSYREDFLERCDCKALKTDSWEALCFFFDRAFMRGRNDKLSGIFLGRAILVLQDPAYKEKIIDGKLSGLMIENGWRDRFDRKLHDGGVNHHVDRKMIISTFLFLTEHTKDNNIISYSIEKITGKSLRELYGELNAIFGIGPKLASLFLCDIVCLFSLEKYIKDDEFALTQPIDTWVDKVIERLGISKKTDKLEDKRKNILKACQKAGVDPIHFNQGCWYAGYYKKIDFSK